MRQQTGRATGINSVQQNGRIAPATRELVALGGQIRVCCPLEHDQEFHPDRTWLAVSELVAGGHTRSMDYGHSDRGWHPRGAAITKNSPATGRMVAGTGPRWRRGESGTGRNSISHHPACGRGRIETRLRTAQGTDDGPERIFARREGNTSTHSERTGACSIWRIAGRMDAPQETDHLGRRNKWFRTSLSDGKWMAFLRMEKTLLGHRKTRNVSCAYNVYGGQGK